MALLITLGRNSELLVEELTRQDVQTMKTALKWKRGGNWERIKQHMYKHGLLKKKRRLFG